ncbi:hypothetical protein [Lentibacter algarum]|uniref:hypothetical protein n=1 Tax=Lentibacter algarum TaxID=576131 RepID=UPI0023A89865|nr:hypothetical protein [Lentibacter algarum]
MPAGTDVSSYSVIFYQFNGTIYNGFSLGTSVATMNGHDIYVINNSTLGFNTGDPMGMFYADDAIALFDGSAVIQFISWAGNTVTAVQDPANGLTSTEVGFTATQGNSLQSDDGGLTYYEQTSVNQGSIPACYATGMLLLTPQAVERRGDASRGRLAVRCRRRGPPDSLGLARHTSAGWHR